MGGVKDSLINSTVGIDPITGKLAGMAGIDVNNLPGLKQLHGAVDKGLDGIGDAVKKATTVNIDAADQSPLTAAIAKLDKQSSDYNDMLQEQRGAVSAATGMNNSALTTLQGAAQGTAPSQAQGVLQQGLDSTIASQMAIANSGNVSGMMGRQKNAQDNAAAAMQTTANNAGMLRAQEMAAARSAFAGATGNTLATDTNAQQNTMGQIAGLDTASGNLASQGVGYQNQAAIAEGQANANIKAGIVGGAMKGAGGALGLAMAKGGRVPGIPEIMKNSYENDSVKAVLSPQEIVIPIESAKTPEKAKLFIDAIFAHEHKLSGTSKEKENEEIELDEDKLGMLLEDLFKVKKKVSHG